ncbi:thermonuclease family protein [Patescibacteria group bacterium]|nr:thermonuclease family protein [Patescibacteria group bacterium]
MNSHLDCPSDTSETHRWTDFFMKGQRIRLFAALGALALIISVSRDSAAGDSIPFCHDLNGYRSPQKGPFLEGNEEGVVHCIVDGDTIDVKLKNHDGRIVRVRLWGVDCPESSMNNKCMKKGWGRCKQENEYGKKASGKVRELLGDGRVTLQSPYKNNGKRKLAYMKRKKGGVDIGRALIKSCLCKEGYKHERKKAYKKTARRCSRR